MFINIICNMSIRDSLQGTLSRVGQALFKYFLRTIVKFVTLFHPLLLALIHLQGNR